MKALALFVIVAFLVLFVGCTENFIEPIVAKNPVKAAPAIQRIQLNEAIELLTPDESGEMVGLTGEITYLVTPLVAKTLGKTLPAKPIYTAQISGRGELAFSVSMKANVLAKPFTLFFAGTATNVVEESGEFIVTFTAQGAQNAVIHVHLGFVLADGQLVRSMTYADIHPKNAE